jgi:3'-phosphoadenosine 5'-phosphosulfate sulfotransferase (PAPS reductase)/FAD synthetase
LPPGGAADYLKSVPLTNLTHTPEILDLLKAGAPVSFSVSGGKDGSAAALLVNRYLDSIGHPKARRQLIHADLGSIEWEDSFPSVQRLGTFLDLPVKVVRRKAGGMVERWLSRWEANVNRYKNLSSVLVISPWSSASLRFCTSELKLDPIGTYMKSWARELSPGNPIDLISVLGLRRDESARRAKAPVVSPFLKASLPKSGIRTLSWNPILNLSTADVFRIHHEFGLPLHMGYGLGNTRISCLFCVLGNINDLTVASQQAQARGVLHQLVGLEVDSLFSFQSGRWLGTVNPEALPGDLRSRLVGAIKRTEERRAIEAEIPKSLHYTKGWPTSLPSATEAALIASVRNRVAALYGWDPATMAGMTPLAVLARYTQLMDEAAAKAPKMIDLPGVVEEPDLVAA